MMTRFITLEASRCDSCFLYLQTTSEKKHKEAKMAREREKTAEVGIFTLARGKNYDLVLREKIQM